MESIQLFEGFTGTVVGVWVILMILAPSMVCISKLNTLWKGGIVTAVYIPVITIPVYFGNVLWATIIWTATFVLAIGMPDFNTKSKE